MKAYQIAAILAYTSGMAAATPFRSLSFLETRQAQDEGRCLQGGVIAESSQNTGQEDGTFGKKDGQAASATDNANFINFCAQNRFPVTDGEQRNGGSCNPIPMGNIPRLDRMISSLIQFPPHNAELEANVPFNVTVQTVNLAAGFFTNPDVTYYAAPQDVNADGQIIGHCHITIQRLGDSVDSIQMPDANTKQFFKGIDDAGDGNGLLTAQLIDGLPAGFYRACTMISAQNHQPVLMPIAQRGAQDDCTKFTVRDNGSPDNNEEENEELDLEAGIGENVPAPVQNLDQTEDSNAGNTDVEGVESQQGMLEQVVDAPIDLENGVGGTGEVVRVDSGTLGGQAPFIQVQPGNAEAPFAVEGKGVPNAFEAVRRSCRSQFKACKKALDNGELPDRNIVDCAIQRLTCGALKADVDALMQGAAAGQVVDEPVEEIAAEEIPADATAPAEGEEVPAEGEAPAEEQTAEGEESAEGKQQPAEGNPDENISEEQANGEGPAEETPDEDVSEEEANGDIPVQADPADDSAPAEGNPDENVLEEQANGEAPADNSEQ